VETTIDSAGRIVIPKALRARLGLSGGGAVLVTEREGRIEIEPAPSPMTLVDRDGVPVAESEEDLPVLTDDVVRATVENTRR
jgi:AbrB family looped-hinge helix DNA binding protein